MALVLAASLLSANFGLAIWLGIAFLLLMILLRKFAWGPITSALEERESTIEESITRAERALAEAKQLQADNESARRDAERQAHQIIGAEVTQGTGFRRAELDAMDRYFAETYAGAKR